MSNRDPRIPEEFRFEYLFSGVVHPERAKVVIGGFVLARITFTFKGANFGGFIRLDSNESKFELRLWTNTEVKDLLSVRNAVRDFIDTRVNVICFEQGLYLQTEIISCVGPDGRSETFGVQLSAMKELADRIALKIPVNEMTTHKASRYLSLAFKDFKHAMADPMEAHFLVYRAIESIRTYYADTNGLDADSDSRKTWQLLREDLGYQEGDFKELVTKANERRHGGATLSTETEIVKSLKFGWTLIYKFIDKNLIKKPAQ